MGQTPPCARVTDITAMVSHITFVHVGKNCMYLFPSDGADSSMWQGYRYYSFGLTGHFVHDGKNCLYLFPSDGEDFSMWQGYRGYRYYSYGLTEAEFLKEIEGWNQLRGIGLE